MIKINNTSFDTYLFEKINKFEYYGFIYVTINNVNNKKYVGQHSIWVDKYLGSGSVLVKSFKKYGKDKFTRYIIDLAKSKEELNIKEVGYILLFNAVKSSDWYNIAPGGHDGNYFLGKSEEEINIIRRKMSENSKHEHCYFYNKNYLLVGELNGFYGKNHSEEIIEKLKKINSGKKNPRYKDGSPNKKCFIEDLETSKIIKFESMASLWNYFRETFGLDLKNKALKARYFQRKDLHLNRYRCGYLTETNN